MTVRPVADPVDLGGPIAEICKRLGLEPRDVAELRLTPRRAEAKVYLKRGGDKYINEKTNEVAVEQITFEITT